MNMLSRVVPVSYDKPAPVADMCAAIDEVENIVAKLKRITVRDFVEGTEAAAEGLRDFLDDHPEHAARLQPIMTALRRSIRG